MPLSRRSFLAGSATLPLLGAVPQRLVAETPIGTGTLTTVSDGHLVLPGSFIFEPMPQDELASVIAEFGLSPDQLEPECNLSLYRDGTHVVLFDAGSGPDFMPSAGTLLDSLDAIGVAPDEITHVVFTHAHPDHIWGVLDDFGDPLFADATYMMGRTEWDYWWDPETVNTIGEARAAFAVGAKRRMEAIEDRVAFIDDGKEILPGVAAILSAGHTPGHLSFEIRSGGDAALVIGDAIGNHHVAFARPDWPSGSDQDAEAAIATRLRLFDRIMADDLMIAGFHLPQGGMGRVEAAGDAYRFVAGGS